MSDSLQRIGEKIAFVVQVAQQAIVAQQLTEEELDQFLNYVRRQDSVLPITNPTAWMSLQRDDLLGQVRERVKALYPLLKLTIPDELRAMVEQPAITIAAADKRLRVIFFAGEEVDDGYFRNLPQPPADWWMK